jgi:hypothetical protein
MQAVDILGGINRRDDLLRIQPLRQRQLHENSMHGRIGVELSNQRKQIGQCDVGRQHMLERGHPGGAGLLAFVAHIDFACRVIADQHHREPRRHAVIAGEARRLFRAVLA